jgi:multicomponent K+:H+ antiporter subunit D
MSHLVVLPILIPVLATVALLTVDLTTSARRALALTSGAMFLAVAAALAFRAAQGELMVYRLGDWPAQYGVALLADRLSTTMLTLTGLLGVVALLHASDGADTVDARFHVYFQMQLAGVAVAFLTNDIFNLFVAFEILLLASYALTVAGGGRERLRAGVAYVTLNLVGSAIFLIGLALFYGAVGTLNMADAAVALAALPAENLPLARLALTLILLVFLLKAALAPMCFWLPHVYAAATAAAAILFAILTKVGVYALLRVCALILPASPATATLTAPWLGWLAIATIAAGVIGALAARRLATLAGNLVLVSSGTVIFAVSRGGEGASAALAYYLPQSTLATAGLFLVAGMIAERRGKHGDAFRPAPRFAQALPLGLAFAVLAITISGLPPLSGFLGKVMLMRATPPGEGGAAYWSALLISGFAASLIFARVAAALFWEIAPRREDDAAAAGESARASFLALGLIVAAVLAFAVFARPLARHAAATAADLAAPQRLIEAVLGPGPATSRETRP